MKTLKPGDFSAVENTEVPCEFFVMGPTHDNASDETTEGAEAAADAQAAQANEALAVAKRAAFARTKLQAMRTCYPHNTYIKTCLDLLEALLEPDDARRPTMDGYELFKGG